MPIRSTVPIRVIPRVSRMDVLPKVSHALVFRYDTLCLEDLNIKGMLGNRRLAKHISDASWGSSINAVRLFEYKAAWNDKQVVKIDRFYLSSKACHKYGWIKKDLRLSIRQWTCKNGHDLDRDGGLIKSAAKNILQQGLKILLAGPADYAGGDSNRPPSPEHSLRNLKPNHL